MRAHDAHLVGEVAHNGQQAGDVDAGAAIVHKLLNVAEAVARPPRLHVVGVPEGRRDDGEDVFDLDDGDEDDGRELAVAVQESERHEADQVSYDGEDDAENKVGSEGRGGKGRDVGDRHDDWRDALPQDKRGIVHDCL